MSAVITSIVCSLILSFTSLYILKNIIQSKNRILTIKNLFIIILLSFLQTFLYKEIYSINYIIGNFLILTLCYKFIFNESMIKIILSTCISLIILMFSDILTSIVVINFISLKTIRGCWYVRIILNLTVSIIDILIINIKAINQKFKKFIEKFESKSNIMIIVFLSILIITILFIMYNISINFKLTLNFVENLLLFITLITFCYIFINENNEFNILNEKYDSLFNYVQTFENWIEKEQLNRHEYKNQLASIRCITKEKKVRDKIDSIMLDNINITNDTVNQLKPIPNGGLKGLLYYKIAIAENKKLNIELDISIKNPEIIKKLSEDKIKILCRLLGIYLDNAIEAAKETKKKIISIEIYEVDKNINIVITNTFDNTNDISKRNDKGFTTKGQGHGKGLYFAKKMIDKSNWLEESQSILDKYYIQRLIIKK